MKGKKSQLDGPLVVRRLSDCTMACRLFSQCTGEQYTGHVFNCFGCFTETNRVTALPTRPQDQTDHTKASSNSLTTLKQYIETLLFQPSGIQVPSSVMNNCYIHPLPIPSNIFGPQQEKGTRFQPSAIRVREPKRSVRD